MSANNFIKKRKEKLGAHMYKTARWLRLRKRILNEHPLCLHCKQRDIITQATDVDHIKPHKGNATLFYCASNLQPLCKQCHARKTAEDHFTYNALRVQLKRVPVMLCVPALCAQVQAYIQQHYSDATVLMCLNKDDLNSNLRALKERRDDDVTFVLLHNVAYLEKRKAIAKSVGAQSIILKVSEIEYEEPLKIAYFYDALVRGREEKEVRLS